VSISQCLFKYVYLCLPMFTPLWSILCICHPANVCLFMSVYVYATLINLFMRIDPEQQDALQNMPAHIHTNSHTHTHTHTHKHTHTCTHTHLFLCASTLSNKLHYKTCPLTYTQTPPPPLTHTHAHTPFYAHRP